MELNLFGYDIKIAKRYSIENKQPKIYNKDGQLLETYFIKNHHSQHAPYGYEGNYFFWDRYNYCLDTHFYGAVEMPHTIGTPKIKYGMLTESRIIVPKEYEVFNRYKGIENEFKYIFSYDEKILNDIHNAKFYPIAAGLWNKSINSELWKNKSKDISMLCSGKVMCPLHQFRLNLARVCRDEKMADTYGRFDGGSFVETVDETLDNYRFSIVIENDISDYYFSERLTSCFASQTIPVYLGARKISDFFNEDGIIFLNDLDIAKAKEILKNCNREYYESHLDAVKDNYIRSMEYKNMQDYLYVNYLKQ